jgi:serine protease inhibitor
MNHRIMHLGLAALSMGFLSSNAFAGNPSPAAHAVNALGLDLLTKGGGPNANALLSPYSIQSALATTFAGAAGETRTELAKVLVPLGMKSAFNQPQDSANFDRMAQRKPHDYLFISEVFHKTFLALDENGTEAAAGTAVVMDRSLAMIESLQDSGMSAGWTPEWSCSAEGKCVGSTCWHLPSWWAVRSCSCR